MKYKLFLFLLTPQLMLIAQKGDPKLTEQWSPVPPVVAAKIQITHPPSDAIILFRTKKDSVNWQQVSKPDVFGWHVADSIFTVNTTAKNIISRDSFGDCQLHIEWRTPAVVKGEGQGRGNSGIFFMQKYELQILDSYNNPTYVNGQAGSIYKQKPPLVNACLAPGEWQSYDVVFTAPRFFENGQLKKAAAITVIHNGVVIHYNTEIWGATTYIGIPVYEKHADVLPIMLQNHANEVSFRNIWIRKL